MNNALDELENLLTDIEDVKVLMYQIEIDFFEQTPQSKKCPLYSEYETYSALFRIFTNQIEMISEKLNDCVKELKGDAPPQQ